jgi:hypothetical protein
MMQKILLLLTLVLSFTVYSDELKWDASNKFNGWGSPIRMKMEKQKNVMLLTVKAKDPIIQLFNQKIDPKKYNNLEIVYRIKESFKKKHHRGFLFFAGKNDKGFTQSRAIFLGKLKPDEKWHIKRIKINEKTIKKKSLWFNADIIKSLRLDITESSRGVIEIKSIALHDDIGSADKEITDFKGTFKVSNENPVAGRYCMEQGNSSSRESIASTGLPFIKVKPNTWYRITVSARNTIPSGEVQFGILQSRRIDKVVSRHADWKWQLIPCNTATWTKCYLEFKTAYKTKGVRIYFKVKNNGIGKAWWDALSMSEFVKEPPKIEIKSFRAVSSFTDAPTKLGRELMKNSKDLRTWGHRGKCTWETLDIDKEPLSIAYNKLKEGSKIRIVLHRAKKEFLKVEKNVSGTGNIKLTLPLTKLPKGKFLLSSELIQNGKTTFKQEKEIWRFQLHDIKTNKMIPVKKVSVMPGRIMAVNGKFVNRVYFSHYPTRHYHDITKFPNIDDYLKNGQNQMGVSILGISYYGAAPSESKLSRKEYLKQASAVYSSAYKRQLDLCLANNYYAAVSLHIGSARTRHGKIDHELVRLVASAIKNHPALLYWSYDEPEIRKNVTPADVIKLYKILKKEDPNHLIKINLCQRWRFHEFAPGSDIASYDYYPFPNSSLLELQKVTDDILKAYPKAPFNTYLQFFNFKNLPMPTFDQLRAEFYQSVVDGSNSLTVFSWGAPYANTFMTDFEIQAYVRVISAHFKQLMPFMVNGKDEKLDGTIPVKYIYRKINGTGCILFVNIHPERIQSVTFKLPAPVIEDFFDSEWKLRPTKGSYSFKLKPYETRAFRVK